MSGMIRAFSPVIFQQDGRMRHRHAGPPQQPATRSQQARAASVRTQL